MRVGTASRRRRGTRTYWALSAILGLLAAILLVLVDRTPIDADTEVPAGSNGPGVSTYLPAVTFSHLEYWVPFYGRIEKSVLADDPSGGSAGFEQDYRHLGTADVEFRPGEEAALKFAVEAQPGLSSYQHCRTASSCSDVEIHVHPSTGQLYLRADDTRHNIYQFLGGFTTQQLEISGENEATGLKVYREVIVNPPVEVSGSPPGSTPVTPDAASTGGRSGRDDCAEYGDSTPEAFTCLFLRQIVPPASAAIDAGVDEAALRQALPDLVQDRSNYRLIVAQEFDGVAPPPNDAGCRDGVSTLNGEVWNLFDPCEKTDRFGKACSGVENGHLFVAYVNPCAANLRSFGKLHIKYGYIEMKFTLDVYGITSRYHNYNAILAGHGSRLKELWDQYGIEIDSFEDFLRHSEVEIDVLEFVPSSTHGIAHQYANWDSDIKHPDIPSTRTNKHFYFCKNHAASILQAPFHCSSPNPTRQVTITMGIEWTPRGYLNYYKVDGRNAALTELPSDKIEVALRHFIDQGDGTYVRGPYTLQEGSNRDRYFEYADMENAAKTLEKVAVGHIPLPMNVGTFGWFPRSYNIIRNRMYIDYMRVWQPVNHYTDMEPVYQ